MTEKASAALAENDLERQLREYGVTRVRTDYFHVNGFRYTDLNDAIAEAKRMKTPGKKG